MVTTDRDTPDHSSTETDLLTAAQVAKEVRRSKWWVLEQIKLRDIPHVRIGPPPLAGRKDTRPIHLPREQADELAALAGHHEHVGSGAA